VNYEISAEGTKPRSFHIPGEAIFPLPSGCQVHDRPEVEWCNEQKEKTVWSGWMVTRALVMAVLMEAVAWGATETVRIPIVLDYRFIRAVLVSQAFTRPGEHAEPLTGGAGCFAVELWKPDVSPEGEYLKVGSHIRTRAGLPMLNTCMGNIEWEGYIEMIQAVRLEPGTWKVRFETVDSRLYGPDRKPAIVASMVWDLIKSHVYPFFDEAEIDLSGPLMSLKDFLPAAFSSAAQGRMIRMLGTLQTGPMQVAEDAIRIPLSMEIEPAPLPPAVPPPKPSPDDLARFVQDWEGWDAFSAACSVCQAAWIIACAERPADSSTPRELTRRLCSSRSMLRKTAGGTCAVAWK
jgi:hypothetical protein